MGEERPLKPPNYDADDDDDDDDDGDKSKEEEEAERLRKWSEEENDWLSIAIARIEPLDSDPEYDGIPCSDSSVSSDSDSDPEGAALPRPERIRRRRRMIQAKKKLRKKAKYEKMLQMGSEQRLNEVTPPPQAEAPGPAPAPEAKKEEEKKEPKGKEEEEEDEEDEVDEADEKLLEDIEAEVEKARKGGEEEAGEGGEEEKESDTEDEKMDNAVLREFDEKLAKSKPDATSVKMWETFKNPRNPYDFPPDPENWTEEDLREHWADGPIPLTGTGWDPDLAEECDWEYIRHEKAAGRDTPDQLFYVPYRKSVPGITRFDQNINTPCDVIMEMARTEEFLEWASYIFEDGTTYEGTVWDDLAHGRGVLVCEDGLVRYEGEWLKNDMEGHGVVEVDLPEDEPLPGSKLEQQWRDEGRIISRDFMSPEDRKWVEMEIEDHLAFSGGQIETPWYETQEWIKKFGGKPEKGRYRYAGQWKHGRMHGCGQYEVNEEAIYGRFYFGKLLSEPHGCEDEIAAMHAGIAEVAAAKARMFINKPDGMVREMHGPFNDPQHPYFYEEEDTWMAPGFINQFFEVPDLWKNYVEDVDTERQMWLNSFYRSPLRLPMPAELEYWWQNEEIIPEFELLNMEPKPDPDDPSKETIEPIILHTPTGRFINYTMDDEHGIRLYWEPEDGVVDPDKVEYLPLGFDEFYGRDTETKETFFTRFLTSLGEIHDNFLEFLRKKAEEAEEQLKLRKELYDKGLELVEAELRYEEALEDLEQILKMKEEEEQRKVDMGNVEEDVDPSSVNQDEAAVLKEDKDVNEEEDDDEDEDNDAPSSFGSANTDQKGGKSGPSLFSAISLSFTTSSLASGIPSMLRQSFSSWKRSRSAVKAVLPSGLEYPAELLPRLDSVTFPASLGIGRKLIIMSQSLEVQAKSPLKGREYQFRSLASLKKPKDKRKPGRSTSHGWLTGPPESEMEKILSLHTPVDYFEHLEQTKMC